MSDQQRYPSKLIIIKNECDSQFNFENYSNGRYLENYKDSFFNWKLIKLLKSKFNEKAKKTLKGS